MCVTHPEDIYSLHLVAIHNIITPSARVNVKLGSVSVASAYVCIFFHIYP